MGKEERAGLMLAANRKEREFLKSRRYAAIYFRGIMFAVALRLVPVAILWGGLDGA